MNLFPVVKKVVRDGKVGVLVSDCGSFSTRAHFDRNDQEIIKQQMIFDPFLVQTLADNYKCFKSLDDESQRRMKKYVDETYYGRGRTFEMGENPFTVDKVGSGNTMETFNSVPQKINGR